METQPVQSGQRYRCFQCGNLTLFSVKKTTRTREFHHFTLGGELNIDESDTLLETIEEVTCIWCGDGKSIEVIEIPNTS